MGFDSLVSRHKDEVLRPIAARHFHRSSGASNVDFNRLLRKLLHERDVFVGGGMKYDVGFDFAEHRSHSFPIGDIRNLDAHWQLTESRSESNVKIVKSGFVVVEDRKLFWLKGGNLPAE